MEDLFFKGVVDFSTLHVKGSPIDFKAVKECEFRRKISADVRRSLDSFTFDENIGITFVPLVMAEVAWHYALLVVDEACENRIEETKKLSRSLRQLREAYLITCRKDLDERHIMRVMDVRDKFIDDCSTDFTILWFTLNSELKRRFYDLPMLDMRTNALLCMVVLDVLERHNVRMDALIKSRLGHVTPYRNKVNEALRSGMAAFVHPAEVTDYTHIDTAMSIMLNNIRRIRFDKRDFL